MDKKEIFKDELSYVVDKDIWTRNVTVRVSAMTGKAHQPDTMMSGWKDRKWKHQ